MVRAYSQIIHKNYKTTMFLEKLTLQGFKSFAKRTDLKFDKGITAVVGPNGSGKSNVADAIKWVLGEQSLKNIRGKKSEDVIFAGSKEKAKMSMAEISLHLNNEDGQMPVDFPEVTFTRRLYRNGDSEYLLNKNQTRLMDTQDLLLKSGFGQKTYSVISQGAIGNILGATPQARKEMFDEAAGVKQFQIRRDVALRKLERTKQNLVRIHDILTELRPRLRSLEKQSEKAKKGETLAKEIYEKQFRLYAHLWDKYTTRLRETDHEHKEIQISTKKTEGEIFELQKKIETEEKRTGSAKKGLSNFQQNLENSQTKRNEAQQNLALTQGKIEIEQEKTTGIDVSGIKRELAQKQNFFKELEEKLENLTAKTEKKKQELSKKSQGLKNMNKEVVDIQRGIQKIQLENKLPVPENLEKNLEIVQKQIKDLIDSFGSCDNVSQLKDLKEKALKISNELDSILSGIKKSPQTSDLQKDILKLQTRLNTTLQNRENLSSEINTIKVEIAEMGAQKQALTGQKDTLKSDAESFSEKIELSKKSKSGQTKAYETLLKKERELKKSLENFEKEVESAQKNLDDFNKKEEESKKNIFDIERKYREKQNALNEKRIKQNKIEIERTKHKTRLEDIEYEMQDELTTSVEKIKKTAVERKHRVLGKNEEKQLHKQITKIKAQLDVIGRIDPAVIAEYSHLDKRVSFLDTQGNDLKDASKKLREIIKELDKKIKKQFEEAFQKINKEFTKYFKILFKGGEAKLILIKQIKETKDEEDRIKKELVESIDIKAIPPGKKLKNISMLSGGEKALTSISLLFAIISNNPSPFIVLDEVDAALDEANSRRFAKILRSFTDKTQFITITHNRETMRQARILYGVTMERNGVSKLLSVKLEKAEKIAE
ncbi:MAG: hypothetical protein ACD_63C00223G0002 [uncultured bacterium]|nr:MAG: hypothetical protein ACD_63C00223G0002 [uncultured bacterium]